MGMTPEQFLESFVEWNLADCRDLPGDIRRGFNAAVSASHLADHYFLFAKRHNPDLVAHSQNLGQFIQRVCQETSGAFKDIRSVSNVYKHLYTDKGVLSQYSCVNSCGSIESLELDTNESVRAMEEDYIAGDEQEGRMRVVVRRNDGSSFELLPTLEAVVVYFRNLVYTPS